MRWRSNIQIYKGCEKSGLCARKSVSQVLPCPAVKNVYTINMEKTWRWHNHDILNCGDKHLVDIAGRYVRLPINHCKYI